MENQSKQSETTDYSECIKRWEQEDVLQLANHFHKLDGEKGQFERTSDFSMNSTDDIAVFNTIKSSIKDLRIYMALHPQDKSEFTFFPILNVIDVDDKKHFFSFIL